MGEARQTITFLCAKCQKSYDKSIEQEWGKTIGQGLGQTPVCCELVDNGRGAYQVCRGTLVPTVS